jgi:hypothetical protein
MKTVYFKPRSIKDVTDIPSGKWNRYIIAFDITIDSQFELDVLIHDNNVYLKPTTPYFKSEFEQLFDFGICCKNYDVEKVVMVTSPPDYYKYFTTT